MSMETANTSASLEAIRFEDENVSEPAALTEGVPVGHATADSSDESPETQEAVFYDVPRPFLTLKQAGQVLGKSIRALERSISGRWGNKLPDGWQARKLQTSTGDEWRIIPPPGFRVRQVAATGTTFDTTQTGDSAPNTGWEGYQDGSQRIYNSSFESTTRRKLPWRASQNSFDQPTIVIDRSDEVEHLLRELCTTQKALSEERRLHLEDMRMIAQLQGSMRLLETNANENRRVKDELEKAKQELQELKDNYNRLLSLSWWQRLFGQR